MKRATIVPPLLLAIGLLRPLESGTAEPAGTPRVLVVFSAQRAAFGLSHELEFCRLLLRRTAREVDAIPAAEATPERLARATHWVIFCPDPNPALPEPLLKQALAAERPVLWIGYGGEQLGGRAVPAAESRLTRVSYRATDWDVDAAYWIPMQWPAGSSGHALLTPPEAKGMPNLALAWQQGHLTILSAVPAPGSLAFLFGDVFLDFVGVEQLEPSRVLLRLEDYQAASDHAEFQRKVDFLAAHGRPFAVSVTPTWRDEATGNVSTLDSAPEYVKGLLYAQAHGGRMLLRGCVREPGERAEFWDLTLDRPGTNSSPAVRRQIHEAVSLLLKHGLMPVGWQTPQDAASRAVHREVAGIFSTAMERPQLSDLTHRETALLPAITHDRVGRRIVPENLGFVPGSAPDGLETLRARASLLTRLRATVAGCYFHAYLSQEKFEGLCVVLEGLHKPFLDLSQLDNWLHIPGRVLLGGAAECAVNLREGTLSRTEFDAAGRPSRTERELVAAGPRLLKRKGTGTYDLYEFVEANP